MAKVLWQNSQGRKSERSIHEKSAHVQTATLSTFMMVSVCRFRSQAGSRSSFHSGESDILAEGKWGVLWWAIRALLPNAPGGPLEGSQNKADA